MALVLVQTVGRKYPYMAGSAVTGIIFPPKFSRENHGSCPCADCWQKVSNSYMAGSAVTGIFFSAKFIPGIHGRINL